MRERQRVIEKNKRLGGGIMIQKQIGSLRGKIFIIIEEPLSYVVITFT